MTLTEPPKSWEKRIVDTLLGFFLRLGARETPENWRGEIHPHPAAVPTTQEKNAGH
jgi:hypothetical protein